MSIDASVVKNCSPCPLLLDVFPTEEYMSISAGLDLIQNARDSTHTHTHTTQKVKVKTAFKSAFTKLE